MKRPASSRSLQSFTRHSRGLRITAHLVNTGPEITAISSRRCISESAFQHRSSPSSYQPPGASYNPPLLRNHGRVDDHPMPDDMPREDYSTPAMYSLSMLARILRYVLYGVVGVSAAGLIGVEGGHQYVEHVLMAYPSHIRAEHCDAISDEALYAWAEENDAWTGGSDGGTASSLGFYARHTLRSAWLAKEYGVGSSGITAIGRDEMIGEDEALKGMIGANKSSTNSPSTSDPALIVAEDYLAKTIQIARTKGIAFPANLPHPREAYPQRSGRQTQLPADRIALDLLTQHADILERLSGPSALRQAEEIYEMVLRSILDRTTVNTVDEQCKEAELLRLAKKLGDVNNRIGAAERAIGWWRWGLSQTDLLLAETSISPGSGQPDQRLSPDQTKSLSWYSRLFSSAQAHKPLEASSVETDIHKLGSDSPEQVMASVRNYPPLMQRALVSLISTYAAHLAMYGRLAEASRYQSLGEILTRDLDQGTASTPPAALQTLWLSLRSSLISMNAVEVDHALGQDTHIGLVRLAEATRKAEDVIRSISAPYNIPPKAQKVADLQAIPYVPSKATPVRSVELADRFGQTASKSPLARPASQLLRDAQRTAAEGWNLSGVLYEKLAGLATTGASERHSLQELALDCHERAMSWSTVASGGEADGVNQIALDEDSLGLGGKGVGKTTEYWRNYMRVRAKLEAAVSQPEL
jgi:hypothetical protein